MARMWKQQKPGARLDPEWTYFVAACGFTFRFNSLDHLRDTLEFYRRTIQPTSRLPDPESIERAIRENPMFGRQRLDEFIGAEHGVVQRWWDGLPLYLQERTKRKRVVRALERALAEFAQP